jgi:hypothetical protein
MDKLESKILCFGVLLLGLYSILFCAHNVEMFFLPVMLQYWAYWTIYSLFLVCLYKYFIDNDFSRINFILYPTVIIVIKFVIDIIIGKVNRNLMDLLLLFFVFVIKKINNKIRTAKKPLLVLGCGILIYVIIAVMFRMKDPIDKTLLLEQNISYLLMLKMRYVNFVINLFVLPCLWIIFRKLTLAKK